MEHAPAWPERLNDVIGQQIRKFRRRRDVTADELARRCSELGLPMSRSKIANMENGRARQEGVSVAEVMVLAAALDTPPALLVFPVGSSRDIELLPGNEWSPREAYRWFVGDTPLTWPTTTGRKVRLNDEDDDEDDDPVDRWAENRAPLVLDRRGDEEEGHR